MSNVENEHKKRSNLHFSLQKPLQMRVRESGSCIAGKRSKMSVKNENFPRSRAVYVPDKKEKRLFSARARRGRVFFRFPKKTLTFRAPLALKIFFLLFAGDVNRASARKIFVFHPPFSAFSCILSHRLGSPSGPLSPRLRPPWGPASPPPLPSGWSRAEMVFVVSIRDPVRCQVSQSQTTDFDASCTTSEQYE